MRDKTIFSDRTYTMEDTYNVKAIVLNRKPYSESDSRVIVYTYELGKLELVARGTKKIKSKLAGHLEPISLTDIMVVRGRQYDYVGAAVSEKCHGQIKGDLAKLATAGRILKIIDQLIKPGVADQEIFDLLKDYLQTLDEAKNDFSTQGRSALGGELLSSFFIFKFLTLMGHQPELSQCLNCGSKIQPGRNRFDLARGGLICGKCADLKEVNQLTVSDDGIKLLGLALKHDFKQLGKVKISKKLGVEVIGVVEKFFKYSF